MKKLVSVLLVAMLMASVLVGCGEGNNDKVLRVGTNAEFPPFEYVGDDGQPDGFDIALIKAIGEKMGYEVVVENMEFADGFAQFQRQFCYVHHLYSYRLLPV